MKNLKIVADEIGIHLVDPVMAFLARFITRLVTIDGNQNGRVEGMEILQFAQQVGFDAFGVFQGFRFPEFWEQLKNADKAERAKLIDTFAKEFDLPNDEVEWLIEDWLRFLDQGAHMVTRTQKLLRKKEDAALTA